MSDKQEQMAGLIERIKSIFDTLLIRDPKELQRRRELRKIHDYLKSLKPSYYKQSSGEVLPAFAVILLDFARILRPICELLGEDPGQCRTQGFFSLQTVPYREEAPRERLGKNKAAHL